MNTDKHIYRGNVQIYLQGVNALFPINSSDQEAHYHIGQTNSELIVRDFRKEPVLAAQKAITTQCQNGFADKFSRQAWAEICYEPAEEKLEIVLQEPHDVTDIKMPLLWMGVLENNIMPGYGVEWEVFKSLDTGQTAFVSLLPWSS